MFVFFIDAIDLNCSIYYALELVSDSIAKEQCLGTINNLATLRRTLVSFLNHNITYSEDIS